MRTQIVLTRGEKRERLGLLVKKKREKPRYRKAKPKKKSVGGFPLTQNTRSL